MSSKNKKTNRVLISAGIAALGIIPVFAFSANLSHTVYADTNAALTSAQLLEQKDNSSVNAAQTKAEQIVAQTQAKQEASKEQTANQSVTNAQGESSKTSNANQEGSDTSNADQNKNAHQQKTSMTVKAAEATAKNEVVIGKSVGNTNQDLANTTANNLKNNNYNFDQIIVGTAADDDINKALGDQSAQSLKDNGFIIKNTTVSGKDSLYVQGKDDTGLFYALNEVNTLANKKAKATDFNERQEPQMSIRGVIEGFYGQPWSDQARKDLFKFMGEHRMNVYIYSPKDDNYLRMKWKELYPADKLNDIKSLVDEATKNHVTFVYTLSPGNDITYSSDDDYNTTIKKFDQLRSIGVKQFYIALDDIGTNLRPADRAKFPNHSTKGYPNNQWSGLADAQAYYLNRIERNYIQKNKLPDLWLVPTNYSGSAPNAFKEAQGEKLDQNIHMQWTGEAVFSSNITSASINRAKTTYNTKHLFIWDNFPVNDSDHTRIYLNPVAGRDADLYKATDGFTANPMVQPYASWFALGSYADYMWNAEKYDPKASIEKVIQDIAGSDPDKAKALGEFVDLNQYWNHGDRKYQARAPQLTNLYNNYQKAAYGTAVYISALQALKERLQDISDLPISLYGLKVSGFYSDTEPWIQAAAHWSRAALAALNIQDNMKSGQSNLTLVGQDMQRIVSESNAANYKSVYGSTIPEVGDGQFQVEISDAEKAIEHYLALQPMPSQGDKIQGSATTNMPVYSNYDISEATDGKLDTKFWSSRSTQKGDTITLSLDHAADIQRIVMHQGAADSNSSGDIFHSANIYAGLRSDGSDKKLIGKVTQTGFYQLDLSKPVKAQYIFIISNTNTDNWFQLREISVYNNTGLSNENISNTGDSTLRLALDGTIETSYHGKLQDSSKSGVISQTLTKPATNVHSVVIIGNAKGNVSIYDGKEWRDIGKIDGTKFINQLPINNVQEVDSLRFTLDPNQGTFSLSEIDLSSKDLNPSQPSNPSNPTLPINPTSPVGPVSPVNPGSSASNTGSTTSSSASTNTGTTITAPHAVSAITNRKANYIYVLVKRNAGIYNRAGKKLTRKLIHRGTQLRVYRKAKKAKGKKFYLIYKGRYKNKMILTSKVKGIIRTLKHSAFVYKANGKLAKHMGKKLLKKKGTKVVTYGKIRTIHGKKMYQIGLNKFVKIANF